MKNFLNSPEESGEERLIGEEFEEVAEESDKCHSGILTEKEGWSSAYLSPCGGLLSPETYLKESLTSKLTGYER